MTDEQLVGWLHVADPAAAVQGLVESALAEGSRDNVTAVVVDIIGRAEPQDGWLDALPGVHEV